MVQFCQSFSYEENSVLTLDFTPQLLFTSIYYYLSTSICGKKSTYFIRLNGRQAFRHTSHSSALSFHSHCRIHLTQSLLTGKKDISIKLFPVAAAAIHWAKNRKCGKHYFPMLELEKHRDISGPTCLMLHKLSCRLG